MLLLHSLSEFILDLYFLEKRNDYFFLLLLQLIAKYLDLLVSLIQFGLQSCGFLLELFFQLLYFILSFKVALHQISGIHIRLEQLDVQVDNSKLVI